MIAPQDFLIFVVNVDLSSPTGTPRHTEDVAYSQYTLPFFRLYCKKYNYPLFILTEPINKAIHPSWYKLMCHSICEAKFILCADLDILIMPDSPPIHCDVEEDKINTTEDPGMNGGRCGWDDRLPWFKYKYNCGLMGFPKSSQEFVEGIYKMRSPNGWNHPWEQIHVNEAIHKNSTPVNVLDEKWNMLVGCNPPAQEVHNNQWHFKHMTCCGKHKLAMRYVWLKEHYKYYGMPSVM